MNSISNLITDRKDDHARLLLPEVRGRINLGRHVQLRDADAAEERPAVMTTYTKKMGPVTVGRTISAVKGAVMDHPFDSSTGGGYGRKTPAEDPERLAREMGEDLLAAGWAEDKS